MNFLLFLEIFIYNIIDGHASFNMKIIIKELVIIIIIILSIKEFFKNEIIYSYGYYKNKVDKKNALRRGQKFFKYCVDDILINQKYFEKNIQPLLSVVIPVYNAELKIKKAIRSIQNQNISNLEIILVNDNSKDESTNIIRNLQKNDKRIILIENTKNKGIFYSRSIGTLKSTGRYIFPLDNDDLFFDEGTIDFIVNESINGPYDIVEFNYAEFDDLRIPPNQLITSEFGNHTNNLKLFQPELGQFPRQKNNVYGVYDCYIWAKCIKSLIYKESINKIGKNIYSKYILRGEDFIITFVLFRIASSFKFVSRYGIFRYKSSETATNKSSRELYLLSRTIYLDIILKFTKNNYTDKMYVVHIANMFLQTLSKEFNSLNYRNKIYFKSVFKKLLNNKYITKKKKLRFISFFNNCSGILYFLKIKLNHI